MGDKRILKSGFWFAVCNVIQKSVMLVTVPIFTRMMTPDEYGLTAIYQSWNSVLVIVVTLSLYLGVFNNGMLHYKDDRDHYISSMQGLSTVSAIFFLALVIILQKPFGDILGLPTPIVVMMFVSFVFLPAFDYWSARNRYEYRYKGLLSATIVYAVVNVVIPVITVKNSTGNLGEAKIWGTLVAMIAFTLPFYLYNFWKGKSFFVKDYWNYAFWFNLPLLPNYLSNMILNQSDRIMIGRFCGEASAGIYSVACYLQTGVTIVIGAVNSAFVPWLYERLEKKEHDLIQKRTVPILLLLGFLTFGIISCAPELIHIMAPQKYYDAIWAVPPVVIGSYFTVLYTLCANVEIYYEKRVFMSCATMIAALLNVVLNYLMIPVFGYIACAYTTVFCYFIYGVAHFLFMNRIRTPEGWVGDYHIYSIKKIFMIYGLVMLLCVIQVAFYNLTVLRYTLIGIACFLIFFIWREKYVRKEHS